VRELRCIGIVNRGEAALRCIRTVKSMRARDGIDLRCLALYTDVDRNAPFVRQADAALRLSPPGASAVSAYLDAAAARTRSGPAGALSPRTPRSPTASCARGSCSSGRRAR
jgi:acetyl/propionyl-CoA carboxylase alpha subunit